MAKKWTPKDEKYLIKHYGKTPNPELAEHFGVSVKSIVNKASSLRKAGQLPEDKPKAPKKKTAPSKKKQPITPLSAITKKPRQKTAKAKPKEVTPPKPPEGPPEYIPSTIMILTEDGWKPIKIDKRKIRS
jgi:hypothetical protein